MLKRFCLSLLLLAAGAMSSANPAPFRPIKNPWTGTLDWVNNISSETLPSGSTNYIQHVSSGGIFDVQSSSPTDKPSGHASFSNVGTENVNLWFWDSGNRYRVALLLDNPIAEIVPYNPCPGGKGSPIGLLLSLTCYGGP